MLSSSPRATVARTPTSHASTRRCISAYRGPLEGLRRSTKRRMTGAVASASAGGPIPTWFFDVPQLHDVWKWEAPTTPELRKLKSEHWTLRHSTNRLRSWLEASDADKPFLEPPRDIDDLVKLANQASGVGAEATAIEETIAPAKEKSLPIMSQDEVADEISEPVASASSKLRADLTAGIPATQAQPSTATAETIVPMDQDLSRNQPTQLDDVSRAISELRSNISGLAWPKPGSVSKSKTLRLQAILSKYGEQCISSLQESLESGQVSMEEMSCAIDPLDANTREHISQPWMAAAFLSDFRQRLLSAIATASARHVGAIPSRVWLGLASKLSAIPELDERATLFARLVDIMPSAACHELSPDLVGNVLQPFIVSTARDRFIRPDQLVQARTLANTLEKLSKAQHVQISKDMSAFLETEKANGDHLRSVERQSFAWLLIRAFQSQSTHQELIDTYHEVGINCGAVSGLQLWCLMTARLAAINVIQLKVLRQEGYRIDGLPMSQRWRSLLAAVLESRNASAGFDEMSRCLAGMGESQLLGEVMLLPLWTSLWSGQTGQGALGPCAKGKAASGTKQALYLRGSGRRTERNWAAWTTHAERLVTSEQAELYSWQGRLRGTKHRGSDEHCAEVTDAKMRLLDELATRFSTAQHLSDLQKLRRVWHCASQQKVIGKAVSSQVIGSLASVVIRDLQQGDMGRVQRINWVIELAAEHQDVKSAEELEKVLFGWRSLNAEGQGKSWRPASTLCERLGVRSSSLEQGRVEEEGVAQLSH